MGKQQELKRGRLMEQAERLFLEKGYKAVTMEEIASAAGISKMTIYNQYHSKENLFTEICLDMVRRFNENVEKLVWQQTNTFDRLRVYFEVGQKAADDYSPAFYKDFYDLPYLIQTVSNYKKETTLQILWDILDEGARTEEIREVERPFMVRLLDVLTAGMMQLMPQMEEEEMFAFNRQLFDFIKRGLLVQQQDR
jgi:AcrR family transcriptional regulator